ncbi:MAG: hypothetical protein ABJA70_23120, partial [Chryseolinea sp.]
RFHVDTHAEPSLTAKLIPISWPKLKQFVHIAITFTNLNVSLMVCVSSLHFNYYFVLQLLR